MVSPADEFEGLKLENQLCFPFYAASRLIVQVYTPYLAQLGLTYPQYLVLLVLWENNGLNVKEISERLYLDSGTLTPILQKLQKMGLVDRKRSLLDDRNVQNFLTDLGIQLKPKVSQLVNELFCSTGLTLEEAAEYKSAAKRLIQKLS
jgi:DNA-binding MarR family transcriptional regulator